MIGLFKKKYLISEECDLSKISYFLDCNYDPIPHKMIGVLFLRIVIIIAVLIKCNIYEDCDYDDNPHKNILFLSLYRIATIIAVFLLGL